MTKRVAVTLLMNVDDDFHIPTKIDHLPLFRLTYGPEDQKLGTGARVTIRSETRFDLLHYRMHEDPTVIFGPDALGPLRQDWTTHGDPDAPLDWVTPPPPELDYSMEYWEKLGEIQADADTNGGFVDGQLFEELAEIEERDRRRTEDDGA